MLKQFKLDYQYYCIIDENSIHYNVFIKHEILTNVSFSEINAAIMCMNIIFSN